MTQTVLKFDLEVLPEGRELADSFDDLLSASQTTLDFWDNPLDDEDWNNA
jgi:hypothetical protein